MICLLNKLMTGFDHVYLHGRRVYRMIHSSIYPCMAKEQHTWLSGGNKNIYSRVKELGARPRLTAGPSLENPAPCQEWCETGFIFLNDV